MSVVDEDTYSTVFSSLKHPLRRRILRTLLNGPKSFSDLQRQMGIESSHLTYHLEGLGSLLLKTENGKYGLSSLGEAAVSTMKQVEEPSGNTTRLSPLRAHRANMLKWLTLLLTCSLVVSLFFNGVFLLRYTDSDKAYGDLEKAYNGLYQAYTNLNATYSALNQIYGELNKTNNQLEDAYANLSQSYLSLLNDSQTNIVRNVNTGMEFATIQEAINAAEGGNTILVGNGVYYEHVTVNKTLTILGASEQDTIIGGSTDSHASEIVDITAENVLFDGFTLKGNITTSSNGETGVTLHNSNGSTVSGNVITDCGYFGIDLENSSNSSIVGNTISSIGTFQGIGAGINLVFSSNNTIRGNFITETQESALLLQAFDDNNLVYGNTAKQNAYIIIIDFSYNNEIYHNTFINNSNVFPQKLGNFSSNGNVWNVGGEGNYWDDYVGLDDGGGGRIAGDGIGDTNLPWHGVDGNPLIEPPSPISVFWDNMIFPVPFLSNSTVSAFTFDQANKEVAFKVLGPVNSTGYFKMSIPTSLLGDSWTITLDNTDVTQRAIITQNQTQSTIYLDYNNSSHAIQIIGTHVIPELSSASTLLFLTILTIPLSIIVAHKRKKRNSQTALPLYHVSKNDSKTLSRVV